MSDALPQIKTLNELVRLRLWNEAWKRVNLSPMSVCNERNGRLAIHELCRSLHFVDYEDDDEYSDIEDFTETLPISANHEIYKLARLIIETSHQQPVMGGAQSVLTVPDHRGNTPLHTLCEYNADPTMMQLIFDCCADDAQSSPPTVQYLLTLQNSYGCTPLHFLAEGRCPLSCLKLMLQYWARPATNESGILDPRWIRDRDGDIPLHWAFAAGASPRRLQLLLEGSRETLRVVNDTLSVPLQEFADNYCDDWEEMSACEMEGLWNRLENILKVVFDVTDDKVWLPLHSIASNLNIIPASILMLAIKEYEIDLKKYDENGMLPLHVAISSCPVRNTCINYDDNLKIIAGFDVDVLRLKTSQGRMAIHLATETNQPDWLISSLLTMAHDSLIAFDPVTGLPPFLLAAMDEDNDIEGIFNLLRKDPSIIQVLMNADNKP